MSQTTILPEITSPGTETEGRWMVTIYNNDHNSFGEVIGILMRATCCTREEAEIEAWEAHTFGKAPVHFATLPECEGAALIISTIGVKAEVSPEWND
jgi:hypothetical protein